MDTCRSFEGQVDIVVLNYNNKGNIEPCLKSIRDNTPGRYNLIVVDQNSHDGTREWLTDNRISPHLILNKKNVGCGEGMNQGIRVGKHPWIVVVHSDIVIEDPNWLDKMWNYTIYDTIGVIEARVKERTHLYGGMAFCMIRRRCFERVGEFDRHFLIGEDLEWWTRLEWSHWKTAYCADTNILHKKGGTIRSGCLRDRRERMELERDLLLSYKYSRRFLEATLDTNIRRRQAQNIKLCELEEG